jgi:hypothetical protein
MIVSNFTPGSPSALQSVDLLARAPKAEQNDGATSSFSDLLGASDRADAPVVVAREPRPAPRAAAPGVGSKSAASPALGGGQSQPALSALSSEAPAAPATPAGLDDAPPLLRDPRLDDPAELALEAAAIAMAAGLLQTTQQLAPTLVVAHEPQLEGGSEKASSQTLADAEQPGVVSAPPVALASSIPVGGSNTLTPSPAGTAPVSPEPKTLSARIAISKVQTSEQPQPARVSLSEDAPAAASVVPTVVPIVTVTAKPAQAVALAASGAGLAIAQQLESLPALQKGAVQLDSALVSSNEGVQTSGQIALELSESALSQAVAAAPLAPQALPDAELLASQLPGNPAAAFFAAQASQQQPPAKAEPLVADSGAEELGSEATPGELLAGLDAKFEDLGLVRKETQGAAVEGRSKQVEAPVSGAGAASAPEAESLAEAGPEVGTFGAREGLVQRETSSASARSRDLSTPVTFEGEASPALDAANVAPSQSGMVARPAHETASRPTVLPPVQTKASELFNVVQSALERARSENPSHLAVEITLEDGSSFGLEVRMSASGLQASFRSESQPLLKALENSWAGFLAKESAEAKVVSAAFEGRSGFGEFSENSSNAGERRQQFEDNASAAFLSNQDGRGLLAEKPQAEAAGRDLGANGGMALYA